MKTYLFCVFAILVLLACAEEKESSATGSILKKWTISRVAVDSNYVIEELEQDFLSLIKETTSGMTFDFRKDSSLIIIKREGDTDQFDTCSFSVKYDILYIVNHTSTENDTAIIKELTEKVLSLKFEREKKEDRYTAWFKPF